MRITIDTDGPWLRSSTKDNLKLWLGVGLCWLGLHWMLVWGVDHSGDGGGYWPPGLILFLGFCSLVGGLADRDWPAVWRWMRS